MINKINTQQKKMTDGKILDDKTLVKINDLQNKMAIIKPDLISKNQIQIVMGWDLVSDFDRGAKLEYVQDKIDFECLIYKKSNLLKNTDSQKIGNIVQFWIIENKSGVILNTDQNGIVFEYKFKSQTGLIKMEYDQTLQAFEFGAEIFNGQLNTLYASPVIITDNARQNLKLQIYNAMEIGKAGMGFSEIITKGEFKIQANIMGHEIGYKGVDYREIETGKIEIKLELE